MSIKSLSQKKYFILACACLFGAAGLVYYYLFAPMSAAQSTQYIYIDNDDNVDSVCTKIEEISNGHGITAFRTLVRHTSYAENIRTGRYEVTTSNGAFTVFRKLKNGLQTPVNLTIPSVRTIDKLAENVSNKMEFSKEELLEALSNDSICKKYGYNTQTIACMFIPETYSIYWNTSVEKFLDKMNKESIRFWNFERKNKAKAMGLNEVQVITLASIVDEETANDTEKPMIAGMYYNRLKTDMPLQADPTVKFALGKFELKRIYHDMLQTESPYNTYKYKGLPPGPIRIPSVAGIEAVLNHVHHDYLYMCAKEDFSGTHNFAKTYAEHKQNAAKYTKALNERGIQ